ncbi:MAG: tRNA glutamyl-Q(34) synthetase GluQRS [Acidimicrobiales bacterium]|nr:tRNA glutamyl-Q(34) synthetase GluQRS [Acidimicrobiales bacterium]
MATGRFAPSPTGVLHLGNLRTALVAWLFARSAGSRFLVRVEDLDRTASRPELERGQLADLAALGIDWDGPVVRQSERSALYDAAIDRLTAAGLVYPCYCTRREIREAATAPHEHLPEGAYPGTCRRLTDAERAEREAAGRRPALRLQAAGVEIAFEDRFAGRFAGVVDDFVIRRNDGAPAYNLAVVVDDDAQGVEEVVRGDDLLATTPRQIHLTHLLGLSAPTHVHVPLVLNQRGERLAKRDGAVTLADQAALGHDASAIRSLLASSLGLCEPDEPVTPAMLVARFDPDRVPRSPWTFSP